MPEWCSRSRTLTIRPSDVASVRWYCPDGAWNAQGATEEGRGTLLGPEGAGSSVDHGGLAGPRAAGQALVRTARVSAYAVRWACLRPYLENCTVDASIFVVKLVRAHGGCLGTRSR